MNLKLIKTADKYIGSIICRLLGLIPRYGSIKYDKILFIQLWGIGETLLTIPALKRLREKYPKAQIDVLTTKRVDSVFEGYNNLYNNIILLSLNPKSILEFMLKKRLKYDQVYDMEEYLNTSAIISFFVGRHRYGFSHDVRSRLYKMTSGYGPTTHVVQNCYSMVNLSSLGCPKKLIKYKTQPVKYIDKNYLNVKKGKKLVGVCVTVSEHGRGRLWPEEKWLTLFDQLIQKYDCRIAIVGGSQDELYTKMLVKKFYQRTKKRVFRLIGRSLEETFYFIENCDLFISLDTGPMHMAAAQGVPTIGLFGPNIPERFGAYGPKCINIYKKNVCPFSPCINPHKGQISECKHQGGNICMKKIRVKEVFEHANKLLKNEI